MTPPKTIAQVRDEMAEDYTNLKYGNYNDTTINAFKAGFDASTKYHEADRDRLADENKRLREVLEFYANPNFESSKGEKAREALKKVGEV